MGQDSGRLLTGSVVNIAVTSIALGLSVMIVSISVLTGFQKEIRDKVTGFGAHIQVDKFDANASFEATPVSTDQPFYPEAKHWPGVDHIQVFAYKAGIIKTEDQIQGVILKGISGDFKWDFFKRYLVQGKVFAPGDSVASDSVVISSFLSRKLKINVYDDLRLYFLSGDNPHPRGRKLTVAGIYNTGLEEFDKMYIIGDLRHIQKLNGWQAEQVSGFEIFIKDFKELESLTDEIYFSAGYDLNVRNIKELYPQIFDWLGLLDQNVVVILVLMVIVSGITMISTLLIIILEKTTLIGVLKALGMNNRIIRLIFLQHASYIILKGMLWGNLIGLSLVFLEYKFRLIPLDVQSYYVDYVPVSINYLHYLLVNVGAFMACVVMMLIPSYIITRISPVRAIRVN